MKEEKIKPNFQDYTTLAYLICAGLFNSAILLIAVLVIILENKMWAIPVLLGPILIAIGLMIYAVATRRREMLDDGPSSSPYDTAPIGFCSTCGGEAPLVEGKCPDCCPIFGK